MRRPLLLALLLAAGAGLLVLALVTGDAPPEAVGRGAAAAPARAEGPATELTAGEAPPPQREEDTTAPARTEIETRPAEEQANDEPTMPSRLELGEAHLDFVVRTTDGAPVQEVTVAAFRRSLEATHGGGVQLGSEDGRYRLEGLDPGQWHLHVMQLPERIATVADARRAHPVPHPGPPPEFVLVAPGSIAGTVRDGSETPARATVHLVAADVTSTETDSSGESGEYGFAGLAPGMYRCWAVSELGESAVREIEVSPGRTTIQVDHVLPEGAWLEVVVLDAEGAPMVDTNVVLLSGAFTSGSESTNEEGRATFGPIAPGEWSVVALIDEDGRSVLSGSATLGRGERGTLELRPLQGGIRVTGSLSRAGAPVTGREVYFIREGTTLVDGLAAGETGSDGRFELEVAGPGAYQLLVDSASRSIFDRVLVPDEETFNIDIRIPGATVAGTLEHPEGHASLWRVHLEREDRYLEFTLPETRAGRRVGTDGRFDFEEVRAGHYRLFATAASSEDSVGPWTVVPMPVEVREDESIEDLVLEVAPGAALQVQVLDAEGQPATGAVVRLRDLAGRLLASQVVLAGGGVDVEGLPPGEVRVSAQALELGQVATRTVRVEAGEPASVTLSLERGASLFVRCEEAGSGAGVGIRLFGPEGDEVTDLGFHGSLGFQEVMTSSERRFGPLPAGRYEALATKPDGRSARGSVTLAAGAERELVLVLD